LALVACMAVAVALIAGMASADTVSIVPLTNQNGQIVGYCFTVCNRLEDRCTEAGCIYDFHIQIDERCKIRKIRAMPKGWTGTITQNGTGATFVTPPPTGGTANPIRPGQCRRFCILVDCSVVGKCFAVEWWTTGQQGEVLAEGKTRYCPSASG
jgi:hypothetical protein